jgi:hypothetical protein
VTQHERLALHAALRAEIAEGEKRVAALRVEETRLLDGCEHTYADGRLAATGGRVKICAICGRLVPARDEKLWG